MHFSRMCKQMVITALCCYIPSAICVSKLKEITDVECSDIASILFRSITDYLQSADAQSYILYANHVHLCLKFKCLKFKFSSYSKVPWKIFRIDHLESKTMYKIKAENVDGSGVNVSENGQTVRRLDYGSFTRMPAIVTCSLQVNTSSSLQKYDEFGDCGARTVVSASHFCYHSPHAKTMICAKAAWVLAKLNYGLIISTTMFVLLPTARGTISSDNTCTTLNPCFSFSLSIYFG